MHTRLVFGSCVSPAIFAKPVTTLFVQRTRSRIYLDDTHSHRRHKLNTTLTTHNPQLTHEWEIFLFAGTQSSDRLALCARTGSLIVRRASKADAGPSALVHDPIDCGVDGLVDLADMAIDRTAV